MKNELTPIEKRGSYYFKRDDVYECYGALGAKSRSALTLCTQAKELGFKGVTTAGSRKSPQINIISRIGKALGLDVVAHTTMGELGKELIDAQNLGAKIIQHKYGYNNVIIKRCRDYALEHNLYEIPFGMKSTTAVDETRRQVQQLPTNIKRIVISIGSGMNLAGLLWGLKDRGLNIPVLGIQVGADPIKTLNKYAPFEWRYMVDIKKSTLPYHKEEKNNIFQDIVLDPIYEAKCIKYLEEGDLFWIIGIRNTKN